MHQRTFIIVCLLWLSPYLFGQSEFTSLHPEAGLLLIQNFSPEDYQGEDQNFSIATGKDGSLFILNRNGVLVYDGFTWAKNNIGSSRSIGIDSDNNVFWGGVGRIGVIRNDSVNQYAFHNLTQNIPEEYRNFKAVERTICTEKEVFFCTPHYLFQWIYESNPLEGEMKVFLFGRKF